MAGIARARPQPLAQHVPISMRRKYEVIRFKDMMRSALGLKGSSSASTAIGGGDADDGDNRRTSMAQPGSARGGPPPAPQRKASAVTPVTPVAAI